MVTGSPSLGFFTAVPGRDTETIRTIAARSRGPRAIAHIPSSRVSPIDPPPTGTTLGRSFFFISPSDAHDGTLNRPRDRDSERRTVEARQSGLGRP